MKCPECGYWMNSCDIFEAKREDKMKYVEVGEVAKIGGRIVTVRQIESEDACDNCVFDGDEICDDIACAQSERKDGKAVCFIDATEDNKMKELKPGEIFKVGNETFLPKISCGGLIVFEKVSITKIEIKRYDIPIGGIVEFRDELYRVVEIDYCGDCDLSHCCNYFKCTGTQRKDKKSISFKRIIS